MTQGQTKQGLLEKAVSVLVAEFGKDHKQNITHFIENLFEHSPPTEWSKLKVEEVVEGLSRLWKLIAVRPKSKEKFEVYHWKPKGKSAVAERVIIDFVNDDMPFLVDSLIQVLGREGIRPRLVLHPVYLVKRDKSGHLLFLERSNGSKEKGTSESIIHCEITEGITSDLIDVLKNKLPEIYTEVRRATSDWAEMRQKIDVAVQDLAEVSRVLKADQTEEVLEFLKWIKDDHFTFLGYCKYDLVTSSGKLLKEPSTTDTLGVLKEEKLHNLSVLYEGITFNSLARRYIYEPVPIAINKTSKISNVHRAVPMDSVWVKRFNARGQVIGIHIFVGLFTSVAYDSSARDIPLLRRKIIQILEYSNLSSHWHDGKGLIHILDSLPRDELFQATVPELSEIGLAVLRLQQRPRVALFVRQDQFNRFLSCLVYIPRERFDTALCDEMGNILAQELKGEVSAYKAQYGALDFARVHYTVTLKDGINENASYEAIEQKLINAARLWKDDLRVSLNEVFSETESAVYYRRYRDAFGRGYQERFKGSTAVLDIIEIEKVLKSQKRYARLTADETSNNSSIKLKIYNYKTPIHLSDILPVLENLNLRVISEIPFKVKASDQVTEIWIHDFEAESKDNRLIDIKVVSQKFLEALNKVWEQEIENDGFNKLVLRAQLDVRQCMLLRAYAKYLRQLQLPFSKEYIETTLVKNPEIISSLVQLFERKFDPKIKTEDSKLIAKINKDLDQVVSIDEDRILRGYLNLIQASVRTNYYQRTADGSVKPYFSIKFLCSKIDEMPLPKPMFEIFVYSPRFEAVHLRGGKVARGGIRWSDRLEDFRTEILGLIKAQMVKNTVIVPVGSKGGFVLKRDLKGSTRDEIMAEGIECYRGMMCGLLDITDNLVGGKIIAPKDIVRWDEDDPYLVVAADKGTATFSDYANGVSKDYKFWLDDAFASGGSAGYDHKKMAITARGAWESVKRHFKEMNIDITKTSITVIGIGDMSGDVFGNGMLLSKHLKLLFGIDHRHIFIDPDPDLVTSFKERQRLFNLPRSSWMDYDKKILSKGGAIFERTSKEIILTPEIRNLLGWGQEKITPNRLIQEILKYPADLLWLGGIGTFIKSSRESNADVGDRTNDSIRVNARDIHVKVVGEGANLGVTQLGRIEFANLGGHINTDAIDNSAGVDCSDHEVNIKILLNGIMKEGTLNLKERNKLLETMTDEVGKLVLRDNYMQTQALSLLREMGVQNLDHQIKVMNNLEKHGKLNRALEFLPDDNTLQEYIASQRGLSRPELAVLMAYSKIYTYDQILASNVPEDFYFESAVVNYFPEPLRQNYRKEILHHPLRREIVATIATNELINRLGLAFLHEAQEKSGCDFSEVVRACFVIISVFDLNSFWHEIENLDNKVQASVQLRSMMDILKIVKRTTLWLLRYQNKIESISETSSILRVGVESFLSGLANCLDDEGYGALAASINAYITDGLDYDFAQRLSILKIAASSPDIILIATETGSTVQNVASLYFMVGNRFGFNQLRLSIDNLSSSSFWHRWAAAGLQEDLYIYQNNMVMSILSYMRRSKTLEKLSMTTLLENWIHTYSRDVERVDQVLNEAKLHGLGDFSLITVVARELRQLCGG